MRRHRRTATPLLPLCSWLAAASLTLGPGGSFAAPAVQWRELGDPARSAHAMVWDSRRDRAIMIGGWRAHATPPTAVWRSVTEPSPHWEPLEVSGGPPMPLLGAAAVYDSTRDRVLVFGGRREELGSATNELWELRLAGRPEWHRLDPEGAASQPARFDASMVLDAQERLVVFGGDGGALRDSAVWVLPLTEAPLRWQAVPLTGGPGPRARHGAALSLAAGRMLVYGGERFDVGTPGFDAFTPCPGVSWELSLAEPMHWIATASAPDDSVPLPEAGGALVADPEGRYAWLIPGDQHFRAVDPSVWRYDFAASRWSRMPSATGGPGLLASAAACFDRARRVVLVHGGSGYDFSGLPAESRAATWGLWATAEPTWLSIVPSPAVLGPPTSDPRMHFDAPTRRLVTWTGVGLWTRDVASGGGWRLEPSAPGSGPPDQEPMSVLDPARHRLLVFGGLQDRASVAPTSLWSWPLDGTPGWQRIAIEGSAPPSAWGTQCALDAERDRVIVLPSSFRSNVALDTLSVLELGGTAPRWSRLPVAGLPPMPRSDASVLVEPARDRLVLAGGYLSGGDGQLWRDVWGLSLSGPAAWTRLLAPAFDPDITTRLGLAVDPSLDRLMLIGGTGLGIFDFGPRRLLLGANLGDESNWSDLDPADECPLVGAGVAFYDPAADRMLWWDGGTLWELTWPFGTPAAFGAGSVTADDQGVRVRWDAERTGPYAAEIERSVDGGRAWSHFTTARPGTDGAVEFRDPLPPASGALGYRATIERGGVRRVLGIASLSLARTPPPSLAFAPPRPNPATDGVVLEFATPVAGEVTLEVFDLSGRRARDPVRRALAAGSTAFSLPLATGLAPGIYLLRVTGPGVSRTARLAVVR